MKFSNVLVIAGLPGSGKTLASRFLSENGWYVVSAGNVIRNLFPSENGVCGRKELQQFGRQYLDEHGFKHFYDLLTYTAYANENVVFEGIRPIEVILQMKEELGAKVLFVECEEKKRIRRLVDRDEIEEIDFERLYNNEMETQVLKIIDVADAFISNCNSVGSFKNDVLSKASELFYKVIV
jgi:dephospho-CoA kinase